MQIYTSKQKVGEVISDDQQFVDNQELRVNIEHAGLTNTIVLGTSTDETKLLYLDTHVCEVIHAVLTVAGADFTQEEYNVFILD